MTSFIEQEKGPNFFQKLPIEVGLFASDPERKATASYFGSFFSYIDWREHSLCLVGFVHAHLRQHEPKVNCQVKYGFRNSGVIGVFTSALSAI